MSDTIPQFFHPQPIIIENLNSPDLFDLDAVLFAQEDTPVMMANSQCLEVPSFVYSGNTSESEYSYYSGSDGYASGYTSSTSNNRLQIQKPKRKRRLSNQINRMYKCDFPDCKKAYEKPSHLKTHKFRKNHNQ